MEETLNKIKIAVDFLKEGQPFTVGELNFSIVEKYTFKVTGWSQFSYFENLTKNQSIKELNEIKILFEKMVNASNELKSFIKGMNIIYELYFDDYGKGSIPICLEKKGVIEWEIDVLK